MTRKQNTFPLDESMVSIGAEVILEAMADGISIQDTDLRVLYQNEAHRALMGEHAGEYCYAAYQLREVACEGCHLLQSFEDGQVHQREASTPLGGGRVVEIISISIVV